MSKRAAAVTETDRYGDRDKVPFRIEGNGPTGRVAHPVGWGREGYAICMDSFDHTMKGWVRALPFQGLDETPRFFKLKIAQC
jgi:hypothetical protein